MPLPFTLRQRLCARSGPISLGHCENLNALPIGIERPLLDLVWRPTANRVIDRSVPESGGSKRARYVVRRRLERVRTDHQSWLSTFLERDAVMHTAR